MKVLITGANGQLGSTIRDLLPSYPEIEAVFADIDTLDLTDAEAVESFLACNPVDYIVNCAAYTAVDKAETDAEKALEINAVAVKNLASAAKKNDARIVHISTDYVFDGEKESPYVETDIPAPRTVYGKTKLKGENLLRESGADHIILRTSWLYSRHGRNFFLTMKAKANAGEKVRVVADQLGCPTNAHDLAESILKIISDDKWTEGTYHFCNNGIASWKDFAAEIFVQCGASSELVSPVSTQEYGNTTPRPMYSVMDCSKFTETFGIEIPEWKESLAALISHS